MYLIVKQAMEINYIETIFSVNQLMDERKWIQNGKSNIERLVLSINKISKRFILSSNKQLWLIMKTIYWLVNHLMTERKYFRNVSRNIKRLVRSIDQSINDQNCAWYCKCINDCYLHIKWVIWSIALWSTDIIYECMGKG